MTDYKNLIVWQKSRTLVKEIYLLTQRLPKSELFGLTNQIRRAVISIPSNIAEGYNRNILVNCKLNLNTHNQETHSIA